MTINYANGLAAGLSVEAVIQAALIKDGWTFTPSTNVEAGGALVPVQRQPWELIAAILKHNAAIEALTKENANV